MSYSQYFSGLPPIYKIQKGQTLASFNIYTTISGNDAILPTIKISQGEWITVLNIDRTGITKIEDNDYVRPVISVKDGDAQIITAGSIVGTDGSASVPWRALKPGSASIFIRTGNHWFLTQFDLSELSDARFADLRDKINSNTINISTIRIAIQSIQDDINIPQFEWLTVDDLTNGYFLYSLDVDNDQITYWTFDLSQELDTIEYVQPQYFGGEKIIRITNSRFIVNPNYLFFAKPDGDHLLSGGEIVEFDNGFYHRVNEPGLYKIRYSPLTKRYVWSAIAESTLPAPIKLKDYVFQELAKIPIELPYGAEFPVNPATNVFRINTPDNYPVGVYVYDGSSWIAQF